MPSEKSPDDTDAKYISTSCSLIHLNYGFGKADAGYQNYITVLSITS